MKQEAQIDGELVSALADGQLHGEAFVQVLHRLAVDPDARSNWHAYHLVGDVLRSGETMVSAHELAFSQRLMLRLQQEPALARIPALPDGLLTQSIEAVAGASVRPAISPANDGSFRWKMLAGFASVVVVGLIVWQAALDQRSAPQLVQLQLEKSSTVQSTSQPGLALQGTGSQPMLRDPQLDALLAAHRQSGGGSALAMSAGFLRNAAFEGAGR